MTSRVGRPRDPARDAALLDAALDELAESGYAGFTVDAVAARAKAGKATVYRRWATKADLILDAVGRLTAGDVDLAALPDTGSLATDLHALVGAPSAQADERRLRIMVALVPLFAEDDRLAAAANDAIVEPWATANRILLSRARDRGEIAADTDVETLAGVIPTMAAYRACIRRLPIPPAYVAGLIDTVLLPALGLRAGSATAD